MLLLQLRVGISSSTPTIGKFLVGDTIAGTSVWRVIATTDIPTLNQNTSGSSGSCTGNAATSTKLAATKNINGVAFDGSADIQVSANLDGWTPASQTWTRESDTTFSEPIDATLKYKIGDKIRYKQGAGYKYQSVLSIGAYSGGKTIITTTGGLDFVFTNGTAITDNYYSHENTPVGFPDWFNVTPVVWNTDDIDNGTGGQQPTTNECRMKISGKQVFAHSRITGVKNAQGSYIQASSHSFPVPTGTTGRTAIGICSAYVSLPMYVGMVHPSFVLYFTAEIVNNAAISDLSFNCSYEF